MQPPTAHPLAHTWHRTDDARRAPAHIQVGVETSIRAQQPDALLYNGSLAHVTRNTGDHLELAAGDYYTFLAARDQTHPPITGLFAAAVATTSDGHTIWHRKDHRQVDRTSGLTFAGAGTVTEDDLDTPGDVAALTVASAARKLVDERQLPAGAVRDVRPLCAIHAAAGGAHRIVLVAVATLEVPATELHAGVNGHTVATRDIDPDQLDPIAAAALRAWVNPRQREAVAGV